MTQPFLLAPYASQPDASRGRFYGSEDDPHRNPFQRDRDRILHSSAFRRLEYKTQVFVNHEGDYYRTRLTHSLEVSQMTRSIARALRLQEDLAEAVALAHDLGHTPFGHAGEEGLAQAMAGYGGFDHNGQTIRILTLLEQQYAEFPGLNLTWETLEGLAKHNGPFDDRNSKPQPWAITEYNKQHDLALQQQPSLEAQVASLADDVAYHNHDLDDGFRARLITLEEMGELPLVGERLHEVQKLYPDATGEQMVHETLRRVIHTMATDIIDTTTQRLQDAGIASAEDVRSHDAMLVAFSETMAGQTRTLRDFLFSRMYRSARVNLMSSRARRIVGDLFDFFMQEPDCLPARWQDTLKRQMAVDKPRIIADYIAGMTDRYAQQTYRKVFDLQSQDV